MHVALLKLWRSRPVTEYGEGMEIQVPLNLRQSGLLLHPTSLSSPNGVGDLGDPAFEFADFLQQAGQSLWQMLPVGPTGGGNSPYDSPSSFAAAALLLDLKPLVSHGWLPSSALQAPAKMRSLAKVHYGAAALFKELRLRAAFREAGEVKALPGFEAFAERNRDWLNDYALYVALRREHDRRPWFEWEEPLRRREPQALRAAQVRLEPEIAYQCFLQFLFDQQWQRLRNYCQERSVALVGDVPMFVRYDGADVWANQHLFHLEEDGQRTALAGVPPDYFSADGQLWGNPVYRWEAMRQDGFAWWVRRLRTALARFDVVRLDHFIGFHRVWHVAPGAPNAREGQFEYVPGGELLQVLQAELKHLPLIAEDLGSVTEEVHALRDRFGLPGMRVLQFAFNEDNSDHLPQRHTPNTVVYTGTHDNDTVAGWLADERSRRGDGRWVYERLAGCLREAKLTSADESDHFTLIELALASVAKMSVFPVQDVLGLSSAARMNVPGEPFGNWQWRLPEGALDSSLAARLRALTEKHGRKGP